MAGTMTDADLAEQFRNMVSGDVSQTVQYIEKNLSRYRTLMPDCAEAIDRLATTAELLETNTAEYRDGGVDKFVKDVAEQHAGKPPLFDQYRKLVTAVGKDRDRLASPQIKSLFSEINKNLDTVE